MYFGGKRGSGCFTWIWEGIGVDLGREICGLVGFCESLMRELRLDFISPT